MRSQRWLGCVIAVLFLVIAVATSVTAVAINVITGGSSVWLLPVQAHPLWWAAGGTAVVGLSGMVLWWAQRAVSVRRQAALLPPEQCPEPWIVDRPDEVAQVVSILVSHGHDGGERLVGLSAVVRGAGGFGKTVVASLVRRHPRVLRRFTGGVYWVTLGRGMESPAALAGRVSQLIARLDPEQQVSFTDPEQAAEHLAAVLAVGPRRLLILDDVWHANQLRAFPVAGHCARLITTRMPSVVAGASMIPVGEVTQEQAATIVNFGLVTPVSRYQLRELLAETGRYPLLLRLVNEILSDQVATGRVVDDAAATVITQLREAGTGGVERLTRDAGRSLDIDDPVQRSRAIAATIEASLGLLALEHRHLFAQTAVFVEDEVVPIHLVNTLWAATAGLDEAQTRALCVRLQDLALVSVDDTVSGGAIRLHGVIRDHLHASLRLDALTHLHQRLVTAVAGTVPTAAAAAASEDAVSSADQVRAWWLLPESERYMYDHLIDHLLAADRVAEAEQLATDLRWVARRLHQAGATAPYTDLTRLTTMRARDLARLFGGVAHLLGPTNPPHSRLDILCSRVAHDPIWGPQTAELLADQPGTHLVNQWNLTDLPSPSLRRTFTSHDGAVNAMAVSSDGTWLAAAISDAVWLWDTATGKHRATLTPDRGSVNAVAIAPDGTWLTTISGYEGTVQLWDVTTGESRAILNGPEGLEHSAAVCPDGTWFATASSFDPKVRLWDAVTGKARAKLVGHQSAVNAVVISPDGTWIATVETYKRMVVLWNAATGEPRFTLRGHSGWVEAVAISADGTWLATADQDGYIKLWDSATGKHRSTLTDGADMVEAMAIAPDGTWLATAHYDGTTRLWDIATGETRAVLTGHTGKVNAVAIAPDGTWLATASDDGTVRLWGAATCERRSILSSNTDGVVAAAIPLEESQIATTDRFHETVQLWAAANDKPRTVVATPGSASTAYAPDGTWFARRDDQDDRIVHLYDVPTGERRHSLTGHTDVVQIVIVAPDGTWLATATSSYDDNVRLWDTSTGEVRHILSGHTKGVDRVAIAPDGSWLATASGGTIRLWDTSTGEIRAVLAHESTFMVAPDGTWLATSGWSGTIRIWDTTTGKNRATLIGHTKWITALVVSLDGTWLTTASYDRTARLWDTATGKNRAILIGHQSTVREIVVSPDETRIATVGADRSVRVWDAITSEAIAMMRFDRQPNKIAWSPSADEIAVLDGGANSYLFKIRAE